MNIKQKIESDLKGYEEEFREAKQSDDELAGSFALGAITALLTVLLEINNSEIPNLSNYSKISNSCNNPKNTDSSDNTKNKIEVTK